MIFGKDKKRINILESKVRFLEFSVKYLQEQSELSLRVQRDEIGALMLRVSSLEKTNSTLLG